MKLECRGGSRGGGMWGMLFFPHTPAIFNNVVDKFFP